MSYGDSVGFSVTSIVKKEILKGEGGEGRGDNNRRARRILIICK